MKLGKRKKIKLTIIDSTIMVRWFLVISFNKGIDGFLLL